MVNCSDPGSVEHAKRTDSSNGQFFFNSNVVYQCEEGYETIGIPILTCKANGSWNRPPPMCRLNQCPTLPPLKNGRISYSNERRTNSKAEYTCEDLFRLNALSYVRYCQTDNQWSPLVPVNFATVLSNVTYQYECLPVECSPPIRPHAGLRILLGRKKKFVPGDVIIYSCESVKTKATAKCRPDGQWSRDPPHCPEVNPRCPQLPHFPHGLMTVEQNKANFSCYEGYKLDGASLIICNNKGNWSSSIPRCVLNLANIKVPYFTNQSGDGGMTPNSDIKDNDREANFERNTSNQLTVLWIVIVIILLAVCILVGFLIYKNRNDKLQRQRWRNYFGHYHHRQSKTNIVVSSTYNNLSVSNGMSGLSSQGNSFGLNAATRHLLQQRSNQKNGTVQHNFLQSSFSSSDENPVEGKLFNTGTISSEHARTISTYADDTCPEDEFEEEEDEDENLYNSASILQEATTLSHPIPVTRLLNNSELTTPPESTPMMFLGPSNSRVFSTGTTDHIYSNVSHPKPSMLPQVMSSALLAPPSNYKTNVPVTEL